MGNAPRATGHGPRATGLLLMMLLAVAARVPAAELGWTGVTVRLYHDGVLTEDDEARALSTAAGILAPAGLVTRWTHCHKGAPQDDACARPLAPGELTLRLVRARQLIPQAP